MILKRMAQDHIDLVAGWLAQEENYKWLDFGQGAQPLSPVSLRVMLQRDIHCIRLFTDDTGAHPIGLAALSDIHRAFKTATLWYVLGDKRHSGKGYTSRGVSLLLSSAFAEFGLHAVHAWAVEINTPSIRVLARNRFKRIGRQRQCHYIDGKPYDRLLFDLLASEHVPLQ